MKRTAFAAVSLAALSALATPVLAADLPEQSAPAYETVPAAQQSIDWTGVYVGGTLGWAFGNFDNRSGVTGTFETDTNGVLGGAYAGYNFQVTPNVVVGAEADITLTDLEDAKTRGGLRVTSKSDWNSNIRGRIGYSFDRFLIYGAGGLALADLEAEANGDTDSKTALGWTAGVGAEAAITKNISARLEYVYQDFGEKDFNLGGTALSSDLTTSQVRLGVGYRF